MGEEEDIDSTLGNGDAPNVGEKNLSDTKEQDVVQTICVKEGEDFNGSI